MPRCPGAPAASLDKDCFRSSREGRAPQIALSDARETPFDEKWGARLGAIIGRAI